MCRSGMKDVVIYVNRTDLEPLFVNWRVHLCSTSRNNRIEPLISYGFLKEVLKECDFLEKKFKEVEEIWLKLFIEDW